MDGGPVGQHGIRLKVLDLPTTMLDFPDGQEWIQEMVNNILIEVLSAPPEQAVFQKLVALPIQIFPALLVRDDVTLLHEGNGTDRGETDDIL